MAGVVGGRSWSRPGRNARRLLSLAAALPLLLSAAPPAAATPAAPPAAQGQTAAAAVSGDWPSFGYDAAHTRYNSAESAISKTTIGYLGKAWTGSTSGSIGVSSPAIANGVVYVGSADKKLYAFAVGCASLGEACSPLWTATTGGYISSSPAVSGGVVYVGSSDHKLYAFDAAGVTGCSGTPKVCTPLWTAATGGWVLSSPAVANGVVYVGAGDGTFYAFDAAGVTGCGGSPKVCSPLWTATATAGFADASPTVSGGVVYIGSSDHKLYAFDAAGVTRCSGSPKVCAPLWTATTDDFIHSSAAVANGVVYVGSDDGKLYAFAVGCASGGGTCTPLWTATTGSAVAASPAVANGVVYVGSYDGKLYAFDAAGSTGCSGSPKVCTPLWTATTGGLIHSSAAAANGIVFVGSYDGKLYAFDAAGVTGCSGSPKTCTPLWTATTGDQVWSSPAVANGVVYVGSNDHKLYAFDLHAQAEWGTFGHDAAHTRYNAAENTISTGNVGGLGVAWTGTTGGQVRSSPAVANGVVYVGSADHKLYAYAIGCANGGGSCTPLWTATTGDMIISSPAVADGIVYVGSGEGKVYAFDAAGVTGCSGSPKACSPLWTATTGNSVSSSPAIANGVVYVGSSDHKLYAFDATGVTGCSGSPKACSPLWTATTGNSVSSSPAIANGMVYVGSGDGKLYAFDAAGATGCSGSPKVCTPLWTATTGVVSLSSPAVSNGVVYVGSADHNLYAFDAAGVTSCSGSPKVCTPLWTAATGSWVESSPAVSNGVVYVGSDDGKLYAFDAAGVTGCSGSPKACTPLWYATTGSAVYSSPAVANGVVYVGSDDHKVYAFDAAGVTECSGSPKSCTPLWTATTGSPIYSSSAIASGVVYVGSVDGKLYAFGLTGSWAAATYFPISPRRVLDTRATVAGGNPTNIGLSGQFVAGSVRTFKVAGAPYVGGGAAPAIPAEAVAVTGNLTIVNETAAGLVALGPTMTSTGSTSTISFATGDIRANNVTVGLSMNGTLSAVYRAAAGAKVHLIFDVTGYFLPGTSGATYHPLDPGRILDTRPTVAGGNPTNIGLSGKFANRVPRTVSIAGVTALGWASALVPADAVAITANLTVTNATSGGYAAIGPTMSAWPSTSTLNVAAKANIANGITVALSGGKLGAVWCGTAGSSADLILDVSGYFTADTSGLSYHAINPFRILNSVSGLGLSGTFSSRSARLLPVGGVGDVPADAVGISGNLTVLSPTSGGWALVSPEIVATPAVSTLNTVTGRSIANGFDVPLGTGGHVALVWAGTVGSTAHLALDVTGYWK
jgi:eukaryotic-like serine/threonine-protein kinase